MTDQSRIAEIEKRAAKATQPSVTVERCDDECGEIDYEIWGGSGKRFGRIATIDTTKIDADFIGHSFADIPYLLTELKAAKVEQERLTARIADLEKEGAWRPMIDLPPSGKTY